MKITRRRLEELSKHAQSLLRALEADVPLSLEDERAIVTMSEQLSRLRDKALYIGARERTLSNEELMAISGKSLRFTHNLIAQGHQHLRPRPARVPQQVVNVNQVSVGELLLNTRAIGLLSRRHIRTIGDLRKYTERELLNIHTLGVATLVNIRTALEPYGITLSK